MEKERDVIEINVVDLFLFMLRRWWAFLLAMVSTLTVGLVICLLVLTPKYESTTKIFILTQQNNGSLAYSDMQISGQLTKNYEQLIITRDVLFRKTICKERVRNYEGIRIIIRKKKRKL